MTDSNTSEIQSSPSSTIFRGRVIYCSDGDYVEEYLTPVSTHAIDKHLDVGNNLNEMSLSHRLLHHTKTISRSLLGAADWAGGMLARAVGLTDSKFDLYLWEHEYRAKKLAEEEANRFIIDPRDEPEVSIPLVNRNQEDRQGDDDGEEERCYTALETLPPA